MRFSRLRPSCLLSLLIASSASAVTIDWVPIGNPGNACDPQSFSGSQSCWGAVPYSYYIGTYEVTHAQYAELLNAVAASDPYGLYAHNMGTNEPGFYVGGITRSGSSGSYTYSVMAGRENMPVASVSYYNAARFANWLQNGKPTGAEGPGTTETGAYTITAAAISSGLSVTRNASAAFFLPNDNEWYKAAYFDSVSTSYFDYPTGTNTPTSCTAPTATPNSANCDDGVFRNDSSDPDVDQVTIVGSFPGSTSPYGTFDQGGNLSEWSEAYHQIFGGDYGDGVSSLSSSQWDGHAARSIDPRSEGVDVGFRLASIVPEPGTGLLVITGLLGLAGWRRARA